MKIDICFGDYREKIECQKSVFLVGFSIINAKNNGGNMDNCMGGLDYICEGLKYEITERAMPDGRKLKFFLYVTENAHLIYIMKKFAGMRIVEYCDNDMIITATV